MVGTILGFISVRARAFCVIVQNANKTVEMLKWPWTGECKRMDNVNASFICIQCSGNGSKQEIILHNDTLLGSRILINWIVGDTDLKKKEFYTMIHCFGHDF
jgi:hypothetical protein